MLWKLTSKGEPEMLTFKLMKASAFGPIFVYDVGGQTLMVTSEMVAMGITRDKFLKSEMPKVRKAMGIEEPDHKTALRKGKKGPLEEEKSKELFKLIQPTLETVDKEKTEKIFKSKTGDVFSLDIFKLKKPVKNNG